jgi:hypothetical protein
MRRESTARSLRADIGPVTAQRQTRPFALVEPRASFTLTSRPSPRQSSRRTRVTMTLSPHVAELLLLPCLFEREAIFLAMESDL